MSNQKQEEGSSDLAEAVRAGMHDDDGYDDVQRALDKELSDGLIAAEIKALEKLIERAKQGQLVAVVCTSIDEGGNPSTEWFGERLVIEATVAMVANHFMRK